MRRRDFLPAALLSWSCGGGKEEPTHIAIGGQAQLFYLPVTLARDLGHFHAEGARVSLIDTPGGAKALEALLGGSAEVVCGFYDHTIQMAAEGRELRSFVTLARYPAETLVVSSASPRRIRRIEDLKGATVGVTAPGSSTHMFLNYLLVRHGLRPSDVSVVGTGGGAGRMLALERGKVDAAILTEPAVTQLITRDSGALLLADTRTGEGVRQVFGTSSYPSAVLYTTARWLDENRDSARRLARAMLRTLAWIQMKTPEEFAAVIPQELRIADTAVLVRSLAVCKPMFSADGLMTQEGAEAVRQVLAVSNEKVRAARIDLAKTYSNEFLR